MSDTNHLRQTIAEELERQPDDIIGSPGLTVKHVITREINNAIKHYESTRFRWNERREDKFAVTVSGTRNYSLPADFVKMDTLKLVYSDAWIFLQKRTWLELEERHRQVVGAQGIPYEYAFYGNVLRLYPVPNQALSLVASYIFRVPPISLTECYTAATIMGGQSLTTTSSASHFNRLNGWTTDGEELIRLRAKAAVEINYFRDPDAMVEAGALTAAREPFLSVLERQAYERLRDETYDFHGTGYVQPFEI